MNSIDQWLLGLINSFAHKSYIFDKSVSIIGESVVIKGEFLTSLLWLAWFKKNRNERTNRETVIAIIFATITSIITTKIIRYFLPFRLRPIHDSLYHFVLPYGVTTDTLWSWSSFPSDTAGFAMALAVGQIFIWGRKGWLAVVFCLCCICFPRVYLGYHYPSDIAAGALVGGLIVAVMCQDKIRIALSRGILSWSEAHAGAFYWIFFLVTYEFASVFEDVRRVLTQVWSVTHHI